MTEEKFNRAIELNAKLDSIDAAKEAIKGTLNKRLSYITQDSHGDWRPVSNYAMKGIGDILDRHDVLIRQEIDDEIQKINKEIELL
jgi:hypothetical protein